MIHNAIKRSSSIYTTNLISFHLSKNNGTIEWIFHWYDNAHQHSILVKNNTNDSNDNIETKYDFYILSYKQHPNQYIDKIIPILFINQINLPSNLICSKVSLDMKLIAIQVSLSSIIVLDIEKLKRWVIFIKSSNDNVILADGIIWSTHGGTSEDLVIVTTKGVELYKISLTRGQCKLSRYINKISFHFWYNPTSRLLLLASMKVIKSSKRYSYPMKQSSNITILPTDSSSIGMISNNNSRSGVNIANEILLIEGYILNSEKTSTMPLLELPPPEPLPIIQIGPGITSTDNIALVTLYGVPYMLVKFVENDRDYIAVYLLSKKLVEVAHYLALNLSNVTLLNISVYDNLLLCHCRFPVMIMSGTDHQYQHPMNNNAKDKNVISTNNSDSGGSVGGDNDDVGDNSESDAVGGVTVVFDILSPPSPISSSSMKQVILPLIIDSITTVTSTTSTTVENKGENECVGEESPHISSQLNNTNDYHYQETTSLSIINDLRVSDCYPGLEQQEHGEWEPVVTLDRSSFQLNKHCHYDTRTLRYLSKDSNRSHSNINHFESLSFCMDPPLHTTAVAGDMDIMSSTSQTDVNIMSIVQSKEQQTEKEAIHHIYYNTTSSDKYLPNHRFHDRQSHCMWEIICSFSEIINHNDSEVVKKKKGERSSLVLTSNEIILFLQRRGRRYLDLRAKPVKENMIESDGDTIDVKSNLETRIAKQLLLSRFYNALLSNQQRNDKNNTYDDVLKDIYHTIMIPYKSSTSLRPPEMLNKTSTTELLTIDQGIDPLEPMNSSQLFSADIINICNAVHEHYSVSVANCNRIIPQSSSLLPVLSNIYEALNPTIVLSTNRDYYGNIICTQSEVLSHIWLPLIALNIHDIKYYTQQLLMFILSMQSETHINVLPVYCILVTNLLFQSQQYEELINILRFHFLPISIELALTVLELSDVLQCKEIITISQSQILIMCQIGLDMLWTLGEKVTVVKWYLTHGQVLEAINKCKKQNGQLWLPPGCISGLEFFTSGISAISILYDTYYQQLQQSQQQGKIHNDKTIERQGQVGEESSLASQSPQTNVLMIVENDEYIGKATDILYSVYMFIKLWDSNLLSTSLNKGKSRLSMQMAFPDSLFSSSTAAHFRSLFGFT